MSEAAISAQIADLANTNPDQAAIFQQYLDSGAFKNFLFYAMGYQGVSTIGNINVTTLQLGGASLDAVQPAIEGEFKQLGATGITFHHASVHGTDSLVIDYTLTVGAGASAATMTGRGYFIPGGDVTYDLTTTCYTADPTACLADGDTMANGMTVSTP